MKPKKIFTRIMVISLLLALFVSCSNVEPTIRTGDVARLRPGMTEEEVIKILGSKPQSKLTQPDGSTEMTWSSQSASIFSISKEEDKTFSILFGPDGKMIRIGQKKGF